MSVRLNYQTSLRVFDIARKATVYRMRGAHLKARHTEQQLKEVLAAARHAVKSGKQAGWWYDGILASARRGVKAGRDQVKAFGTSTGEGSRSRDPSSRRRRRGVTGAKRRST